MKYSNEERLVIGRKIYDGETKRYGLAYIMIRSHR